MYSTSILTNNRVLYLILNMHKSEGNDTSSFMYIYRVPCSYPNKNITIKIDESSNYPHYLAFVIWNQQGRNDITAVQLCEVSFRIFVHSSLVYVALC